MNILYAFVFIFYVLPMITVLLCYTFDRYTTIYYLKSNLQLHKSKYNLFSSSRGQIVPNGLNLFLAFLPLFNFIPLTTDLTKKKRTIHWLTAFCNQKFKCDSCSIVSAFWNLNYLNGKSATCPHCSSVGNFSYVNDPLDEHYPFYKKQKPLAVFLTFKKIASEVSVSNSTVASGKFSKQTLDNQLNAYEKLQQQKEKKEVTLR